MHSLCLYFALKVRQIGSLRQRCVMSVAVLDHVHSHTAPLPSPQQLIDLYMASIRRNTHTSSARVFSEIL